MWFINPAGPMEGLDDDVVTGHFCVHSWHHLTPGIGALCSQPNLTQKKKLAKKPSHWIVPPNGVKTRPARLVEVVSCSYECNCKAAGFCRLEHENHLKDLVMLVRSLRSLSRGAKSRKITFWKQIFTPGYWETLVKCVFSKIIIHLRLTDIHGDRNVIYQSCRSYGGSGWWCSNRSLLCT